MGTQPLSYLGAVDSLCYHRDIAMDLKGFSRPWGVLRQKKSSAVVAHREVRTMLAHFCGKLWQNGEFGLSCVKKATQPLPDIPYRTHSDIEQAEWIASALAVHGAQAVLEHYGIGADPLGYSPRINSHSRKKRGALGISAYGRRLVRNACHELEGRHGRQHLSFATFTLPAISRQESLAISRQWAEIVRVFLQRLRRGLISAGLPAEIVGVTEVQEERTNRDGILALHLHIVFVGRHPKRTWAYTPSWYRGEWVAVISRYVKDPPETYNWSAVENVVRVKFSAESYLGKYMSKGLKSVAAISDEFGVDCLPSAWHTCSASLRDRVLGKIRGLSPGGAQALVDSCSDPLCDWFVYRRPIQVMGDSGRLITLGWMGRLRKEYIEVFCRDRDEYNARAIDSSIWNDDGYIRVD